MKKRRNGNLLQRMTAVFLSAVLVAGTLAGAVPTEVFAAENTELSGAVSENTAEMAEEETSVEPLGETVSGNDAVGVQSEETVSGNDAAGAQPEETQPQELSMLQNLEMQTEFYAVSDFSALKTQIKSASGELEIRLAAGTISMTETISVPQGRTVTLLADGGDCILQRANGFTGAMFSVQGTLKLGNAEDGSGTLILDGGAVWDGEADAIWHGEADAAILGRGTTNNGASAESSLLIGRENSEIYLYPSALLQNNSCSDGAYGGAVTLYEQGAKLYLHGGNIVDNATSNGGGAVKTYKGALVKMTGGEISGNYAGAHGGAFQIYSSEPYVQGVFARSVCEISGGTIRKNLCNRYGGGIAVSDHSSLALSGNAQIINNRTNNSNGSDLGGGIAFGDSDTALSLAGDVVVSGNMRGEETNNLHIGTKNNLITIDTLSGSASIGITMEAGTGAFSNSCDTECKSSFFSDKPNYKVVSGEENVLSLAEAQTDDNIAVGTGWVLDKDGVLTIQNDTGMAKWIENGRETNGSQVKQAVLQNGVTRIGSDDRYGMPGDRERGAFSGCSNLKSITIPGSVSRIGSWAFSGCSNLASIAIPGSVSSIGEAAFENCSSLTSIAIPSGVTEIEGSTFLGCRGLTDVTIPSGMIHIGSSAFSGCSSLTGVTIPNSVTSIANNVFCDCSSLTSITIPSGLERIYYSLFEGCSSLTSIEIPSSVTEIDSYAFKNCSRLKSITIPDSVTTIGFQTFQNCSSLKSITIPSGVTAIAYQAFCGCSSLNHVTMQGTIPPTLGNEVFGNCKFVTDNTQGIHVPGGYAETYKTSWTDWKNYITDSPAPATDNIAFGNGWVLDSDGVLTIQSDTGMNYWIVSDKGAYKSEVKKVKLQDGVTTIPYRAFWECGSLTDIEIPDSVTGIGEGAFWKCSSLGSIEIPSGVERIEKDTFEGCSKLTSITIPDSVTSIGEYAFRGCSKLADIELPSSVSSIMFAAFGNCSSLTSIEIPSGVTSIEGSVFSGCSSLTDIKLPTGVTGIGSSAFSGCSGLESITIPSSVTSIGSSAFSDCSSLKSITIPSKVTSIEGSTFSGCSGLTGITIPSKVTSIGEWAFQCCSGLTDITIPSSVTSIGGYAFQSCSSLANVTMQREEPPEIGEGVFDECQFTSFTFGKSIMVPAGCADTYKASWTAWANYIKQDAITHRLSLVPEKAATCTQEGNRAYYTCSHCSNWYEYGDGTGVILNHDSVVIPKKDHTYSATEYEYDKNGHWQKCSVCQGESARTPHSLGAWATTKPATANEEGSKERSCDVCDYKETAVIPATGESHTHSYGSDWKSDGTNHWHECSCGVISEEAAHTFGDWTITKPAMESEDGSRERSCSVCQYKQTEVIPKTGETSTDSGKIETDKEQGENTPDADFGTSKDGLIDAVLTPEEQSLVEAGTDIKIVLDIDNIDAIVNQSDKQVVTEKAGEYAVGQYLDINLYKIIGADKTKISHTSGKIRIVLTVPDSLKNTDSAKTRSYAVVRVHDGVAEMLADTDNDEATITIETDLFSTYAFVYKDTAKTGGQNPEDGGDSGDSGNTGGSGDSGNESNGSGSNENNNSGTDNGSPTADAKRDNEPKTGDATPVEIYATLTMIAGLSYLLLLFGNGKKGMTEQEKKELTAALVAWGRKGGKLCKAAALAAIFLILVYYHSIGKKMSVDWQGVYGE